MSFYIELLKEKDEMNNNYISIMTEFDLTQLKMILGKYEARYKNLQVSSNTIYCGQMSILYNKVPGECSCSESNSKKIIYGNKKQNECNCLIPATFKVIINKTVNSGIIANCSILIVINKDSINIHWEKLISYTDGRNSSKKLGSKEATIINIPFDQLDKLKIVVNDNRINDNPCYITVYDKDSNIIANSSEEYLEDEMIINHNFTTKTITNKEMDTTDLDELDKYKPFEVDEDIVAESYDRHVYQSQNFTKNVLDDLKSKIIQFVGDDKKKEGDEGNGE